jgi:hypothetical protein
VTEAGIMGQAENSENRLIEELLGQADHAAVEMALAEQRHQLAEEEDARLRARAAWLKRCWRPSPAPPGRSLQGFLAVWPAGSRIEAHLRRLTKLRIHAAPGRPSRSRLVPDLAGSG